MSETLTLEKFPAALKKFWMAEAKRNARSMSDEIIAVLEDVRRSRAPMPPGKKDMAAVMAAVHQLQALAAGHEDELDDKLLYGDDGMPK